MLPTKQGAIRLFRLFGIDVFLHWSWFIVAIYRFQMLAAEGGYRMPVFYALEILGLFAIVTMHEFGHSLACRQVGGRADQIVLWPFGGVAYVAPPERPGAQLWSIAAGPLVNVVLVPVLWLACAAYGVSPGMALGSETYFVPDAGRFLSAMFVTNFALLVFNILPIFPLDGGQILRSILWFPLGRAKSLLIAAAIGFVGVLGMGCLALYMQSIWFGLLTFFVFSQCRNGWKAARAMMALEAAPRREEFACPRCHVSPPSGPIWRCQRCREPFDTFANNGICPHCHAHYAEAQCTSCGQWSPVESWRVFNRAVRMSP
jgi:Zn-dependent protease